MPLPKQESLIALGANLPSEHGDPAQTLMRAALLMVENGLQITRFSRFFLTPCFPAGAGPDYVNACVSARTTLSPSALLQLLSDVEAKLGRVRDTRWASRTLDLDLIAYGQQIHPDAATQTRWRTLPPTSQATTTPSELIVPHPRLQERAFVLVPLRDIAPHWRHPLLDQTVSEMCEALPDEEKAGVTAI